MKLLIPVGAIIFGSGFCCCSGDFLEGFKQGAEEAIHEAEQKEAGGSTAAPEGGAADGGGGTEVAAGALDGTCGRFKEMGVTAPAGSKVTMCTTDDSSTTLLVNTEVDTEAACKTFKGWVEGQGFTIQTEGTFGGTSSIVAHKDSDQLVIACMKVMGKNSVTLSLQKR